MIYYCPHCGKKFKRSPSENHGKLAFCSKKCSTTYYNKHLIETRKCIYKTPELLKIESLANKIQTVNKSKHLNTKKKLQ